MGKLARLFFLTLILSTSSVQAMDQEKTEDSISHFEDSDFDEVYATIREKHLKSGAAEYPVQALQAMFQVSNIDASHAWLQKIIKEMKHAAKENPGKEDIDNERKIFLKACDAIRSCNPNVESLQLISAMLKVLNERYTEVLPREYYERFMKKLDGHRFSTGVSLYVAPGYKSGKLRVFIREVMKNSPSDKAGICIKDELKKIGEKEVNDIKDLTLLEMITEGQLLPITVMRNGKSITFELKIEKFQEVLVESHFFSSSGLGYIKIKAFAPDTVKQFDEQFKNLKKKNMRSLILSIQGNIGGDNYVIPMILKKFYEKGLYAIRGSRKEKMHTLTFEQGENFDKPIIILMDQDTASSSEVFLNALKRNNHVRTLGKRTAGKGVGQSMVVVNKKYYLKLTDIKILDLDGQSYDEIGISPEFHQEYDPAILIHALRLNAVKQFKIKVEDYLLGIDGFETSKPIYDSFQQDNELYVKPEFAGAIAGGELIKLDEKTKTYIFRHSNKKTFEMKYVETKAGKLISLNELKNICPKITWEVQDEANFTINIK